MPCRGKSQRMYFHVSAGCRRDECFRAVGIAARVFRFLPMSFAVTGFVSGNPLGAGLRGIGGKRRTGKGCRCGDAYRRLFPGHTSAGLRPYGVSVRIYALPGGRMLPMPVSRSGFRFVRFLSQRLRCGPFFSVSGSQQLEIAGRSPGSAAVPIQNRGRELRSGRKIGERAGTSRYVIGRRRGLCPGTRGPFSRRSRRYGR